MCVHSTAAKEKASAVAQPVFGDTLHTFYNKNQKQIKLYESNKRKESIKTN